MGLVDEFQKLHNLCKELNNLINEVGNNLSASVKKLNDLMTKEFGSLQGKRRGLKKLIQRVTDYLKSLFGDSTENKKSKKKSTPNTATAEKATQTEEHDTPDTPGTDKVEDDTQKEQDTPEEDETRDQSTSEGKEVDERLKQLLKFSVLGHSYPYGVKLNRHHDEDTRTVVGVDTKVTLIDNKETAYTCFNPEKDEWLHDATEPGTTKNMFLFPNAGSPLIVNLHLFHD